MPQNRKEPRKVFIARAQVAWEDPLGHSRLISAMIEDTSDSGLSLRVDRELSVGCKLEVTWHKASLQGVVMNCRKDGFGFILGVRREFQQ